MKSVKYVSIGAFLLAFLIGVTAATPRRGEPKARNLLKEGNLSETMVRARELLTVLKQNDWVLPATQYRLLRVPDQDFAQDEDRRKPNVYASFCCDQSEIYAAKVAFFSDLYVRNNLEVVPGIEGISHYQGFYIVAWKDGRIETIDWDSVRLLPFTGGYRLVFPGMDEYDGSLPGLGDPEMRQKADRYLETQSKRFLAAILPLF